MDFLGSIRLEELKRICFDETMEILCDNDVVGSFTISFKPTASSDKYSLNTIFHVAIDGGSGGFEMKSILTDKLKTIEYEKYEFSKTSTFSFDRKVKLLIQPDGSYNLAGNAITNEIETPITDWFSERDMLGFVSDASGLILQRVISLRNIEDIVVLSTLGQDLDLCRVVFTPKGEKVRNLRDLDFTVFFMEGQIRSKNRSTVSWTSYYHHTGYLMFYNQDNNPLYCLLLPESDKVDSKFYVNLREKHGVRYFYTIDKWDIEKIIFPEVCKLLYGKNVGIFFMNIDKLPLNESNDLHVHHHKFTNLVDGFEKTSIISHVTEHLETLLYLEYEILQRNSSQEQKIMYLSTSGDSILATTIEITMKEVSRYSVKIDKDKFNSFLSKASVLILQRLLARRGLKYDLNFSTFSDNMNLSKQIFRPISPQQSGDLCDSSGIFGLESSIIPKCGNISVWNYTYDLSGHLINAHPLGCPVLIENNSANLFSKYRPNRLDIFKNVNMFKDGLEFLKCLDMKDLSAVLFDETLTIINSSQREAGYLEISIENHLASEDKYFILHMESSFKRGGKTFVVYIEGKLSFHLDTLEQTMIERVLNNDEQLYEKKVVISKKVSEYHICKTTTDKSNSDTEESVINEDLNIPFVSETSCLIIDRLIVRKNVSDILTFWTLNAALSPCLLKYRILPKDWWFFHNGKCEVFCMERVVMPLTSKVQIISSLTWKLKFSLLGYSIERIQMDETFTMVPKLTKCHSCCMEKYPLLPLEAMHNPPFNFHLNDSELQSLLFNDCLCVLSKEGDVIGSYSSTVDRVQYKDEVEALLVEIHSFASFEDDVLGNAVTAYLNFELEILDFRQLQFSKKGEKNVERSVAATKDCEGYIIQTMETENSVISHEVKKWCTPKNKPYICESSLLLIRRLYALRKIEDPLDFITFNMSGDACRVQLIPQGIEKLYVGDEQFDVLVIRSLSTDCDSDVTFDFETKLTRRGCTVSSYCLNVGKIVHPCLLPKEISDSLKEEDVQLQSLPSFAVSQHAFDLFVPHELDDLPLIEELDILTEDNKPMGQFTFTTSNVHYRDQHCLLLQIKVLAKGTTTELITSTEDLIEFPFRLIKHMHTCFVEAGSSSIEKRIFVRRRNESVAVKQTLRFNEANEVVNESVLMCDADGLVSEASCLLFLKLLAKRNIHGHYQFISLDVNKNVCLLTVRTIGYKKSLIEGIKVRMFGVEIQVTPFQKCSLIWRSYFDERGVLLECKPFGLPIVLRKRCYTQSKILNLEYPVKQQQLKFLSSIDAEVLDSLIFLDHACIVYKDRVKIGKYTVLVESVHYNELNCLRVCLKSSINTCDKECSTYIDAILSSKFEILTYFQQEYISPETDMKLFIKRNEDVYNVEIFQVKAQEILQKSQDIPCTEFFILCCEAVNILILRLLTIKKIKSTLEFLSLDKAGELCRVHYHSIGWKSVRIYNYCLKAWRILNETRYKDGQVLTWEYNMSHDGHMLSRKQSGVPVIIIVPPEKCTEYNDSMC